MVAGIVDGKNNMDEKTREVAYIMMYHFGWNSRQLQGVSKKLLLSKLAMANISVDDKKSTIIFHDKCR